jgi:type IV secretion system protein VirB1
METPKEIIVAALRSESLDDFGLPGVVVEVDAATAEDHGAFEEDALTEADAWESNCDPRGEGADG